MWWRESEAFAPTRMCQPTQHKPAQHTHASSEPGGAAPEAHRMPAAFAAASPMRESSITTQRAGLTPNSCKGRQRVTSLLPAASAAAECGSIPSATLKPPATTAVSPPAAALHHGKVQHCGTAQHSTAQHSATHRGRQIINVRGGLLLGHAVAGKHAHVLRDAVAQHDLAAQTVKQHRSRTEQDRPGRSMAEQGRSGPNRM